MEGKYLFNPTYTTEAADYEGIPYSGIIIAYFVELVNDLINEVNEISECDDFIPAADVQEYVTNQFDFDRDEILQDVTDLLPHGTEISPDQIFHIGRMVADNLLYQYEGDAASPSTPSDDPVLSNDPTLSN